MFPFLFNYLFVYFYLMVICLYMFKVTPRLAQQIPNQTHTHQLPLFSQCHVKSTSLMSVIIVQLVTTVIFGSIANVLIYQILTFEIFRKNRTRICHVCKSNTHCSKYSKLKIPSKPTKSICCNLCEKFFVASYTFVYF